MTSNKLTIRGEKQKEGEEDGPGMKGEVLGRELPIFGRFTAAGWGLGSLLPLSWF